jgi:hypothetical protein
MLTRLELYILADEICKMWLVFRPLEHVSTQSILCFELDSEAMLRHVRFHKRTPEEVTCEGVLDGFQGGHIINPESKILSLKEP